MRSLGSAGAPKMSGHPKALTEHLPELSVLQMGAAVFIHWSPSLVGQLLTPRQSPRRLDGSPLQPPCQSEALQPLRHEVVSRRGQQEGAVWMLHPAWAVRGGAEQHRRSVPSTGRSPRGCSQVPSCS